MNIKNPPRDPFVTRRSHVLVCGRETGTSFRQRMGNLFGSGTISGPSPDS